MKTALVAFVLGMLAACASVEPSQDDNTPTVSSAESDVVHPNGGGPGAFCGGFADPPCNAGLFCAGGICRPPGGSGAFCGGFADPPCGSGLFCAGGICRPPGGPGAFCGGFADPPCRSGLFCSGGICR